jgi:hypothetical protein
MFDNKKILIAAGGTGGHINPALGTAGYIKEKHPTAEIAFVGTADKMEAKLVPQAGSTTVIERTLDERARTIVKESYNDNSVTTDAYTPESEACFEQYYIYGFAPRLKDTILKVDDATNTKSEYVDVQGYGYTEVKPVMRGRLGTGTLVEVYDYVTGECVERFYVVIFGDIDGNSLINNVDSNLIREEIGNPVWSVRTNRTYHLFKAANLDGNRLLNNIDSTLHKDTLGGNGTIDQTTGLIV